MDIMNEPGNGTADATAAQRYRVLDTYRFLAAAGIVLYHFEAHFRPFMPGHVARLEKLQCFVDFFFVLSGFVLMHTYGRRSQTWSGHKDFLWKRFARLYPLHLATLLLCCLIAGLVPLLGFKVRDPSLIDLGLLPSNLLLIQAWGVNDHPGLDSPSWSISAEAFVYILFPLLVVTLGRLGVWKTVAVALAVAASTALVRDHWGLGDASLATYDFGNLRALPAFTIGMATCRLVDRVPVHRVGWALPHALGLAVVASMLADAPTAMILAMLPPLVGTIAVAERGGARSVLASRVFVMLGNASFAIYLIHSFFQVLCVSVVRASGWTGPLGLAIAGAACFLAIIGAGVISTLYFELPMQAYLRRGRRAGPVGVPGLA